MKASEIKRQVKNTIEGNPALYCGERWGVSEVFGAFTDSEIESFVVTRVGYSLDDAVDFLVDDLSQYANLEKWDLEKDIYDYIVDNEIYFVQLSDNGRFYIIQQ